MFHFIGFLIFGLIVGLIARALTPGHAHMSLPVTAGLGIMGAEVAGWIGRALRIYGPNDSAGFLASTLGAVLLLYVYHSVQKQRAERAARDARAVRAAEPKDKQFPRKVG
jgi:uncharacterized membrane protein YeaQ/YmgE (transglycosylase-associated protein family)